MKLAQSVADVLRNHVTLEVEGIDRMYVNAVIPILQSERGISWFFREIRGHAFASSALMAPMTRSFVESLESFASSQGLEVVTFQKKQRKDAVAAEYRAAFTARRACSSWERPRKRPPSSGHRAVGTRRRAPLTPGCTARRPW